MRTQIMDYLLKVPITDNSNTTDMHTCLHDNTIERVDNIHRIGNRKSG